LLLDEPKIQLQQTLIRNNQTRFCAFCLNRNLPTDNKIDFVVLFSFYGKFDRRGSGTLNKWNRISLGLFCCGVICLKNIFDTAYRFKVIDKDMDFVVSNRDKCPEKTLICPEFWFSFYPLL